MLLLSIGRLRSTDTVRCAAGCGRTCSRHVSANADSVSAADGDTVTIGYYLPLSGANATIPRITSMPSTSPSRRSMQRVA